MTDTPPPNDETTENDESTIDSSLSRIIRNSTFNAAGMFLILPLNFVALFTMARRLGAASMGVFFTVLAIAAVIHWIADAGITTVLTRHIARTPELLRTHVAEALGMMLLVVTSSVLLFLAVATPWTYLKLDYVPWALLLTAAVVMVARHMIDFAANIFRGIERFEFENLARVTQALAFCLFVWFFVPEGASDATTGFLAYLGSNSLAAVVIWACLFLGWCAPLPKLDLNIARRWYKESFPLGVGDVVRQLFMQLDTLLLSALSTATAVGLFAVAVRPLQPLRLVPRTIVSVTFPMMSRAAHLDHAQFSQMFAKTTNLLWIAAFPICIGITVCAGPFILATAGPKFTDAILPLQIVIWATIVTFINTQLRFAFTAFNAEHKYWRLCCGSLIAKAIVCTALITTFGLYGACIGLLASECVVAFVGLRMLRTLDVHGPSIPQLLRVVPAVVAMVLTLIPFTQSGAPIWWVSIGMLLSGVVYLAACLVMGAWPREDVQQFLQVVRRGLGGGATPAMGTSRGS
ncbi:flippase [Aeoliella sp.]|uniref:flippase n=1 Tax=Aeoliella sp. TaxID=2795800 RepID=UPI003CCB9B57